MENRKKNVSVENLSLKSSDFLMQTKVRPNYSSYENSKIALYLPVKLCHRK